MIKKSGSRNVKISENLRGGNGEVIFETLLEPAEMYDKGRLCSLITLKPGCSIGYHVHENEMEAYYILRGTGEYSDNGALTAVAKGDVTWTPNGEGHSISNNGDEDLELAALIIYEPKEYTSIL